MPKKNIQAQAKLTIYSKDLKTSSDSSLPKELTGKINLNLLAQAKHIFTDRSHAGTSRAKTRAEVDITKKKIYRQKGTGGARHGASSAPVFVGGGAAHGPHGIKRILQLPRGARKAAMYSALTLRASEGKVFAVEGLAEISKSKEIAAIVRKVIADNQNKAAKILFVVPSGNQETQRAIRNVERVSSIPFDMLNAIALLTHAFIVFDSGLVAVKKETKVKKSTQKTK